MRTVGGGLLMGLADSVPGISGGTVAFLLGFHARLVANIAAFGKLRFNEVEWWFLIRLGLALVAGIFIGAKLILTALEHEPILAAAVLAGLVLRAVPHAAEGLGRQHAPGILIGTVIAILASTVALPATDAVWFLPIAGAIAASAMILPGISGAFLLLLMGLYEPVLEAVSHLELRVIVPVAAGAIVGLLLFTRGLHFLLENHRNKTHAVLVGLLLGSLVRLWPWRETLGGELIAIAPGTVGMVLVVFWVAARKAT